MQNSWDTLRKQLLGNLIVQTIMAILFKICEYLLLQLFIIQVVFKNFIQTLRVSEISQMMTKT